MLFISQQNPDQVADLHSGHHIAFKDISTQSLRRLAPKVVVCPLVSAEFDAIQLLERLNALGYAGQCLVISAKLPQQALVLAELNRAAGPIRVRLIDSATL